MILVKYNQRYHFFDEDLYASDLATRAETQFFPCKNKKLENSVLK